MSERLNINQYALDVIIERLPMFICAPLLSTIFTMLIVA